MALLLNLSILYAACFLFYQADEGRARIGILKDNASARFAALGVGLALVALSIALTRAEYGLEQGAPVWFCLFSVAGAAGLFVSARAQRAYLVSGAAASAASLIGLGLWGLSGGGL